MFKLKNSPKTIFIVFHIQKQLKSVFFELCLYWTVSKRLFKKNQNEIFDAAQKNGMTPLRNAAIEKLIDGTTSVDEVIRVTVED